MLLHQPLLPLKSTPPTKATARIARMSSARASPLSLNSTLRVGTIARKSAMPMT